MSLSDSKLRSILGKEYNGKAELSDRDGLSVRITPKGVISWQYRFRLHGKNSRVTLGRYPDVKIAEARSFVPELRGSLANDTDPRVYWKQRNTQLGKVTVRFCCEQFLTKYAYSLKPGTIATYQSCFRVYLYKAFEDKVVEKISLAEWISFFDEIAKKSRVTAGAVLKQVKTILSWCVRRMIISNVDVLQLRITDVGSVSQVGSRVLTTAECGLIWLAIDKRRATQSVSNSIKACMLTGARISELLKAKREDFDLESLIWTVPAENSKTNQPIRRPISQPLLNLLNMQWRIYRSKWTFPAPNDMRKHLGLASVNKFVRVIRPDINIPLWRLHDFRRTVSTRMSEQGVLPHVTEKMLGHKLGGVMAVYNKHDWLEEQASAYACWGEMIMGELNGTDE
ncbi:site-specific integrase [Shewanella sp. ULN5]|uniref:tyrosine-type recombinase/integrase n=1 Tax=Shewanella sp. ULN5 TaxID=2994678 RepID=UPI00273FF51B|nr:site-specific integrase [Shewanella sp. ULN5]MDP5145507.1 site-specific integrase [Shewanella sp. ULN5]